MLEYAYRDHPETVRLYESGLSLAQVAAAMGVSSTAIFKRLAASGVDRRPRGGLRKPVADIALALVRGATLADAVLKTGAPRSVIIGRIYARKYSKPAWLKIQPFTREEKDLIRVAFDTDGLSFPDVIEIVADHRRQG